jgi:hypothetical protein
MEFHVYWDMPWHQRPTVSNSLHRIPDILSLQCNEFDFHELWYKVTQLELNPTNFFL